MKRAMFIITEVRETPNAEPKLHIEIKLEPMSLMHEDSHLKQISEFLIDAIDDFRINNGGKYNFTDIKKYRADDSIKKEDAL